MKEVEDKIKKARGIAQQIEQALSNGDWEQVAPDSPRLHEEVEIPHFHVLFFQYQLHFRTSQFSLHTTHHSVQFP